ncbi:MAG: CBS domain-containing protein [Clostridiaceae bacterium]
MNIMFFLTPKSETVFDTLDTTLQQVLERMDHHRLTAIPVIDKDGRYIGTLTEGDILRVIKSNPELTYKDVTKYQIGTFPRRTIHLSVKVDEKIENIVKLAMSQNFVPVVDDEGVYIGIIKRADIIEYCYNSMIKKPAKAL